MPYQPNINNNRVYERIQHAYGFLKIISGKQQVLTLSQTLINKHFGQSQHELSKWLRRKLLNCVNHSYSIEQHITKQYEVNTAGAAYIRFVLKNKSFPTAVLDPVVEDSIDANIKYDELVVTQVVVRDFGNELTSGNFVYNDKSSRLWHPIQNIKREQKKKILATSGYNWQYDIECCAPTLILQHAQHLGMDEYLFAIQRYISNKLVVRNELSALADIPVRTAKVVINALFCGARLGASQEFALYHELDCDKARVMVLKEDTFITELRNNIKTCWDTIQSEQPMTRKSIVDKNGTTRMLPVSSRQKWGVYFDLERQVLNSVRKYLKDTNNKHFTEHDGWACQYQIDEEQLIAYVKKSTGFDIKLSKEELVSDINDPSLRAVSAAASIPSFANAHSDIDLQQAATPSLGGEHYTDKHYHTISPIVYNFGKPHIAMSEDSTQTSNTTTTLYPLLYITSVKKE